MVSSGTSGGRRPLEAAGAVAEKFFYFAPAEAEVDGFGQELVEELGRTLARSAA